MADITGAKLVIEGVEAKDDAGTLTADIAASPPTQVTLKASVEPAGEKVTWSWTKDDTALSGETSDTYAFKYTDQFKGKYIAAAKQGSGASKSSNAVKLSTSPTETPADTPPPAAVEVEVGEYDRAFAYITLVVLAGLSILALFLLTRNVGLDLPGINDRAPASGTFSERLRAYAVVLAVCAGFFGLAVGGWLGALEVRGRLRRVIRVPAGKLADNRGVVEEAAKILDSASKLRATIAVLVAAVALLLGALWTVGQTPEPTPPTTTTTPPTNTAVPGAGTTPSTVPGTTP